MAIQQDSSSQKRLAFLDGWRVLAVSLVLLAHLSSNTEFSKWRAARVFSFMTSYGSIGVLIFFFISGFVVSRTCLEEKSFFGDFSIQGFYIRRIYRIVPPLLIYLATCSALGYWHLIDFSGAHVLSSAIYLCNTTLVDCNWYGGHTWTLAFEEQFYLCFPILFSVLELKRSRKLGMAVVLPLALLPFVFTVNWIGKTGFLVIYALFIAGYVAARSKIIEVLKLPRPWQILLGALAIAVVFFPVSISSSLFVGKYFKFLYVPAIPALVLLSGSGLPARFLSVRWLAYIGRATYSIYLWQQLVTGPLFSKLPIIDEIAAIGFMIVGCVILFATVEQRLIKRGRELSNQLRRTLVQTPQEVNPASP